jgi:hypothetical protein
MWTCVTGSQTEGQGESQVLGFGEQEPQAFRDSDTLAAHGGVKGQVKGLQRLSETGQ